LEVASGKEQERPRNDMDKYKANPKLGVGQVARDLMKNIPICVLEFPIPL